MKLTKIHRIIRFKQRAWLKEYIDLNTGLRAKSTSESEKDFFKLMNNSVFGKMMENIRKRVDVKLVNTEKQALKLVAKPNFDRRTIFNDKLVAVHMKRTKLVFNKPIYLGFAILDLSKILMYDFHYNFVRKMYGSKAKLLFTDTDSLAYEIETEDFYKDMIPYAKSKFDTSNYPTDHPSGMPAGLNKKVVGMFKDECGGKNMTEFVGLRAKMYAYKVEDEEHKKAKGVKKNVIQSNINFDDYKTCLETQQRVYKSMNIIRSRLHTMYTEEITKRHILEDKISTLAHGHYKIEKRP